MTARETILTRVREALTIKAPVPGHHHEAPSALKLKRADQEARHWLPTVGVSPADWMAQFSTQAMALRAQLYLLEDAAAAHAKLQEIATAYSWKRIAFHNGTLTQPAIAALQLPTLNTSAAYDPTELEQCDIGLTECDALIAQTGSVLLTSRQGGGRALSVLPPHHIVLARRDQLLPDLPAAYEQLHQTYGSDWPSMITLITGPSRTGDIERILVLGAHGPKKLSILVY